MRSECDRIKTEILKQGIAVEAVRRPIVGVIGSVRDMGKELDENLRSLRDARVRWEEAERVAARYGYKAEEIVKLTDMQRKVLPIIAEFKKQYEGVLAPVGRMPKMAKKTEAAMSKLRTEMIKKDVPLEYRREIEKLWKEFLAARRGVAVAEKMVYSYADACVKEAEDLDLVDRRLGAVGYAHAYLREQIKWLLTTKDELRQRLRMLSRDTTRFADAEIMTRKEARYLRHVIQGLVSMLDENERAYRGCIPIIEEKKGALLDLHGSMKKNIFKMKEMHDRIPDIIRRMEMETISIGECRKGIEQLTGEIPKIKPPPKRIVDEVMIKKIREARGNLLQFANDTRKGTRIFAAFRRIAVSASISAWVFGANVRSLFRWSMTAFRYFVRILKFYWKFIMRAIYTVVNWRRSIDDVRYAMTDLARAGKLTAQREETLARMTEDLIKYGPSLSSVFAYAKTTLIAFGLAIAQQIQPLMGAILDLIDRIITSGLPEWIGRLAASILEIGIDVIQALFDAFDPALAEDTFNTIVSGFRTIADIIIANAPMLIQQFIRLQIILLQFGFAVIQAIVENAPKIVDAIGKFLNAMVGLVRYLPTILNVLAVLIDTLARLLGFLEKIPEPFRTWIVVGFALSTVLAPFIGIIISLISALWTFVTAIKMAALGSALFGLQTGVATPPTIAFGISLKTLMISLGAIAAIFIVVMLIMMYWKELMWALQFATEGLEDIFIGFAATIHSIFQSLWQVVQFLFTNWYRIMLWPLELLRIFGVDTSSIVGTLITIFQRFHQVLQTLFGWFIALFTGSPQDVFRAFGMAVKAILEMLIKYFELWYNVVKIVVEGVVKIIQFLVDLWKREFEMIAGAIRWLIEKLCLAEAFERMYEDISAANKAFLRELEHTTREASIIIAGGPEYREQHIAISFGDVTISGEMDLEDFVEELIRVLGMRL